MSMEVKVTELYQARIVVENDSPHSSDPVGLPTNEELVQMVVSPAERYLQSIMKLGNRAVATHQQTTPDLRADLPYPDGCPDSESDLSPPARNPGSRMPARSDDPRRY